MKKYILLMIVIFTLIISGCSTTSANSGSLSSSDIPQKYFKSDIPFQITSTTSPVWDGEQL